MFCALKDNKFNYHIQISVCKHSLSDNYTYHTEILYNYKVDDIST